MKIMNLLTENPKPESLTQTPCYRLHRSSQSRHHFLFGVKYKTKCFCNKEDKAIFFVYVILKN